MPNGKLVQQLQLNSIIGLRLSDLRGNFGSASQCRGESELQLKNQIHKVLDVGNGKLGELPNFQTCRLYPSLAWLNDIHQIHVSASIPGATPASPARVLCWQDFTRHGPRTGE